MTAWDLANNPAQASIEFRVSDAPSPVITNVRNQPNPFSDETNITFEHNRAGSLLDIQVDIFSTMAVRLIPSGKVPTKPVDTGWRILPGPETTSMAPRFRQASTFTA
jgi:hypothetical protein